TQHNWSGTAFLQSPLGCVLSNLEGGSAPSMDGIMQPPCNAAVTGEAANSSLQLAFPACGNRATGPKWRHSPRLEAVAGTAHCPDRVRTPGAHQRLAQSADVHINGALVNVDLIAPHAVEQLAAREHPPRRLHEELEQPVVGRAQMDHR